MNKKNGYVLGFCSGHDASAFVVDIESGQLVFAVEEERLNRIKKYLGNPTLSIAECEKRYGDNWNVITHSSSYHNGQILNIRKSVGNRPVKMVDHHFAHAVSAYYHSGFERCLAFTSDGAGPRIKKDHFSPNGNTDEFSAVFVCDNGEPNQVASTNLNTPNFMSMGMYYFWLTYRLGFKPNRHEGKITGLAAHGDPEKFYDDFNIMYVHDDGTIRYKEDISYDDNMSHVRLHAIFDRIADEYNIHTVNSDGVKIIYDMELRKDIAASAQAVFDDINSHWVQLMVEKYGIKNVCLAGGCFANVKTNQHINELDCVDEVFVQPAMTDAGTALGAALWQAKVATGEWQPTYLEHVLYGPRWDEQEVINVVEHDPKLQYEHINDIEKTVAQLLDDGKIVAKYDGGMEYGPRALGSRTILCHPRDRTAIDWLNKRLHRCYDEDTEILTLYGWKPISEVDDGEVVATMNMSTGEMEYQKILDRIAYDYEGDMFRIDNGFIDLLITPNHNMLIIDEEGGPLNLVTIDEIYEQCDTVYCYGGGIDWFINSSDHIYLSFVNSIVEMDEWVRLLAYWLLYGEYYNNDFNIIINIPNERFHIYEEVKNTILTIFSDVDGVEVKASYNSFTVNSKDAYMYLTRRIPLSVRVLPRKYLSILFDIIMQEAVYTHPGTYRYVTSNAVLADNLQEIAIKLGYRAKIEKTFDSDNVEYTVCIDENPILPIREGDVTKEHYSGRVYCVSVPNGNICVRRNGKALFCGNSEFMPFAPAVLEEYVDDVFISPTSKHTALFMTICYDVAEKWRDIIQGVVHVDGTARPQIVPNNEIHCSYYKVIDEYRKITGIPVLINTSANRHEEPIVCSPHDAMGMLKDDAVDYVWSYNLLISKKGE